MPYFSINQNTQRLQLSAIDEVNAEIDDFVPAKFQGSLDVVAAVNQFSEHETNNFYQMVTKPHEVRRSEQIPDILPPHLVESGGKEFSIERFIKCGTLLDSGRYSELSVERVTNPKTIKLVESKNNARVYFSSDLPVSSKNKLVSAKAAMKDNSKEPLKDFDGCKMTFMVESTIYYNGKNEVYDKPLPINIFNFCYPKFDNYPSNLLEEGKEREITSALEEMMRINLLAIIYEAQKQGKPLPFIIPAPGSFFAQLKYQKDKDFYMVLISDAINKVVQDYKPLLKKYISEFILLNKDMWNSTNLEECSEIKFHKVNSDMIEIADKLRSQGIICPIPMMAHPSHKIGNGYANYFRTTPVDEILARASGNSHGITFSKSVIGEDQLLKDVEIDRTFKTLKPVYFTKSGLLKDKCYFQRIGESEQHKIFIEQRLITPGAEKIDVAPMFSLAIKEAVKGLELFEGFEDDEPKAQCLKFLLDFAKDKKGVGNKINELEAALNKKVNEANGDEEQSQRADFIIKFCSQAKTFSYHFQKTMNEFGIKTGNETAKKIVGARLHRMASEENIEELFKNTALHKSQVKQVSHEVQRHEVREGGSWREKSARAGGGERGGRGGERRGRGGEGGGRGR